MKNGTFKLFVMVMLSVSVFIACGNSEEETNTQNSTSISVPQQEDTAKVKGTVDIPSNLAKSDIAVTNFRKSSELAQNNSYQMDKEGVVVAADKSGNIVYFSYPDETGNLNINPEETAVALIINALPLLISPKEGKVPKSIKNMILSYSEVKTLVTSVKNAVSRKGYFDVNDVKNEYNNALKIVVKDFVPKSLVTRNKRLGVDKIFRNGVKVDIEKDEKTGPNTYKLSLNVNISQKSIYNNFNILHSVWQGGAYHARKILRTDRPRMGNHRAASSRYATEAGKRASPCTVSGYHQHDCADSHHRSEMG